MVIDHFDGLFIVIGLQIWMLTGDKLETATCIAKSSRLVARNQSIHVFRHVTSRSEAHLELNAFRRKQDAALVIKGDSLEVLVEVIVMTLTMNSLSFSGLLGVL